MIVFEFMDFWTPWSDSFLARFASRDARRVKRLVNMVSVLEEKLKQDESRGNIAYIRKHMLKIGELLKREITRLLHFLTIEQTLELHQLVALDEVRHYVREQFKNNPQEKKKILLVLNEEVNKIKALLKYELAKIDKLSLTADNVYVLMIPLDESSLSQELIALTRTDKRVLRRTKREERTVENILRSRGVDVDKFQHKLELLQKNLNREDKLSVTEVKDGIVLITHLLQKIHRLEQKITSYEKEGYPQAIAKDLKTKLLNNYTLIKGGMRDLVQKQRYVLSKAEHVA
jgi:hypothetical protein